MPQKSRLIYAALFCLIFLLELLIALFVRDDFVRPYVGDMLVTVLLCCFFRVLLPNGAPTLPLCVFLFATAVEVGQYFDLVALLGLENSKLLSTLLGRTFSVSDLICYAAGCLIFRAAERIVRRPRKYS